MLAETVPAGVQVHEVLGDAPHFRGHRGRDSLGRETVAPRKGTAEVLEIVEVRVDALERTEGGRIRDQDRHHCAGQDLRIEAPDDFLKRARAAILVAMRARLHPNDWTGLAARDDHDGKRDGSSVRRLGDPQQPADRLPATPRAVPISTGLRSAAGASNPAATTDGRANIRARTNRRIGDLRAKISHGMTLRDRLFRTCACWRTGARLGADPASTAYLVLRGALAPCGRSHETRRVGAK